MGLLLSVLLLCGGITFSGIITDYPHYHIIYNMLIWSPLLSDMDGDIAAKLLYLNATFLRIYPNIYKIIFFTCTNF